MANKKPQQQTKQTTGAKKSTDPVVKANQELAEKVHDKAKQMNEAESKAKEEVKEKKPEPKAEPVKVTTKQLAEKLDLDGKKLRIILRKLGYKGTDYSWADGSEELNAVVAKIQGELQKRKEAKANAGAITLTKEEAAIVAVEVRIKLERLEDISDPTHVAHDPQAAERAEVIRAILNKLEG